MSDENEPSQPYQPRLVLAHPKPDYAVLLRNQFLEGGWTVHMAADGPEARELAADLDPNLVVLATELPTESGYLSCAKITQDHPGQAVVLLGSRPTDSQHRYASFVGAAALIDGSRAVPSLMTQIVGSAM